MSHKSMWMMAQRQYCLWARFPLKVFACLSLICRPLPVVSFFFLFPDIMIFILFANLRLGGEARGTIHPWFLDRDIFFNDALFFSWSALLFPLSLYGKTSEQSKICIEVPNENHKLIPGRTKKSRTSIQRWPTEGLWMISDRIPISMHQVSASHYQMMANPSWTLLESNDALRLSAGMIGKSLISDCTPTASSMSAITAKIVASLVIHRHVDFSEMTIRLFCHHGLGGTRYPIPSSCFVTIFSIPLFTSNKGKSDDNTWGRTSCGKPS